jgi:tRNA 5-methylaminomethyl-2-thiouridine biosynthesis bifunctional protein
VKTALRQQSPRAWLADSIYLDGFSPDRNPEMWDLHTAKALARLARRGACVATWTVARSVRDALSQAGFIVKKSPGSPPKRDSLQGTFDPSWPLRAAAGLPLAQAPARCVVVGAGLAGAAVAASLARRGWKVTVLDAAAAPAAGASSLPAGVLAPHVSPDDSVLSQLSRSGVRATLQQAHALLESGIEWQPAGVLERCLGMPPRRPPPAWRFAGADLPIDSVADAARDWLRTPSPDQLARSGLSLSDGPALWHAQGGWITPAALVREWLTQPGIEFRGGAAVARLVRDGSDWQVLDGDGRLLAEGERVVLSAGVATAQLAGSIELPGTEPQPSLALQPIRGQVTLGRYTPDGLDTNTSSSVPVAPPSRQAFPDFPVNGHGSFIAGVPAAKDGLAAPHDHCGTHLWLAGATYQRGDTDPAPLAQDDAHNLARLQTLLPIASGALQQGLHAWTGVRCATPHRLPALGPLDAPDTAGLAGVWVCTGMGSRGLTFAALCGELLAARWHAEPLPVAPKLAQALMPRFLPSPAA